jgi:excisionase family DNA binding protein
MQFLASAEATMIIHRNNPVPQIQATDCLDLPLSGPVRSKRRKHLGNSSSHIPFLERPTCTIGQACSAVGLGRTKFYELIKAGDVKTVLLGRRRLVHVASLMRLLGMDNPT